MKHARLLLVLCPLIFFGCAASVNASSPRPNVMLAAEKAPARFAISQAVGDEFESSPTGGVTGVMVHSWRTTLTRGYFNAFLAPTAPRTLELLRADLSFGAGVGPDHILATIRFQARSLDASGNVVAELAGVVQARESGLDFTRNAQFAVEAMYEKIATDLLAQ